MKRFWVILFAFLAVWPVAAYEMQLIPVLQVNTGDQVDNVLPKYGIAITSLVEKVGRFQPFQIEIPLIIEERLARPLTIRATLTITGPDGRKDNGFENIVLFELPAGAQGIFFPEIRVSSHFSAADKIGVHRFELIYSDGSQEKCAAFEIELADTVSDLSDMDEQEFSALMSWYYRNPKPHRLLIALTTYIEYIEPALIRRDGRERFNPRAAYKWFAEVFKLNPQFYGDLAQLSHSVPEQSRLLIAVIFAACERETVAGLQDKIHPEVLRLANDPEVQIMLDTATVSEVWHLDMLMAEFMATGRFAPVLQIAGQLQQREKITLEELKERPGGIDGLSADERQLLKNGLIGQCAAWMLRSNIQQGHTLLAYYLETILHRKQYADRHAAEQIIAILTSKD
ncbi:MAG: hypothetical protein IKC94_06160 [Lentisphaeria bacterium]|nr:hypothetical protein [Lentisphaeria bacterium]